jgi:hypothetical protein
VLCYVSHDPTFWYISVYPEGDNAPGPFGSVDLYESTLNLTTVNDVKNYVAEAILEGRW